VTPQFIEGFLKQAKLKKDVELQVHQKRILKRLEKNPSLLLWHGLGSGKTLSAIAAVGDTPTDFLLPASLRGNLDKELAKFTTNHDVKGQSYTKYLKSSPSRRNSLVLDEAHRLGTPTSGISKLLMERAPSYNKRILLTGSPLRNHPSELAPLIRILDPSSKVPLNRGDFESKYISEEEVDPGFFKRVILGVEPGIRETIKNKKDFQKLVQGKIDYHMAGDKYYPSVTESHVPVVMSPSQRGLYDKASKDLPRSVRIKMEMNIPLAKSEKVHLNNFFNSMRQISNSVRSFGVDEDTPKMLTAAKDLEKQIAKGGKTLVYSNFLESGIGEYADILKRKEIPYVRFDGSLSDKKRKAAVDAFNAGNVPVLLVSGAGSEGLDLKGTRLVQVLEPHWNQARTDQVKGRAVRFKSHEHLPKREQNVTIKNYYSTLPSSFSFFGKKEDPKTSVDQYLRQLGEDKTKLNMQFLNAMKERANEY